MVCYLQVIFLESLHLQSDCSGFLRESIHRRRWKCLHCRHSRAGGRPQNGHPQVQQDKKWRCGIVSVTYLMDFPDNSCFLLFWYCFVQSDIVLWQNKAGFEFEIHIDFHAKSVSPGPRAPRSLSHPTGESGVTLGWQWGERQIWKTHCSSSRYCIYQGGTGMMNSAELWFNLLATFN